MLELIVPYKEDCKERRLNKEAFLRFYEKYDDITITLVEDYTERRDVFNMVAETSDSKYIALTDVDTIIVYDQLEKALFELENGADLVYPYDYIVNIHKNGTIRDDWPQNFIFGQMVLFNRQKFLDFGGENRDFIGYGWEDMERYYRALNYGLEIRRIEGMCMHMQHPRFGWDNPHFTHNKRIYEKERKKWLTRKT